MSVFVCNSNFNRQLTFSYRTYFLYNSVFLIFIIYLYPLFKIVQFIKWRSPQAKWQALICSTQTNVGIYGIVARERNELSRTFWLTPVPGVNDSNAPPSNQIINIHFPNQISGHHTFQYINIQEFQTFAFIFIDGVFS